MKNILKWFFYNLWYLGKPPWDTGISPPELIRFIDSNPPGKALDLGCGTGTNAIKLAQNHWQVTGVDFVPKAIKKAQQRAQEAGVDIKFILGDVTNLSTINTVFDLVLDIGCYHNLTKDGKLKYIRNLKRLLAPRGTFLLYAFIRSLDSDKSGASDQDLATLADQLTLISRQDGKDHGMRPSSWLMYVNNNVDNN
jgi:ubiquinone/menaquinone biosynthesis C-methylase UbiE